MRTSGAFPGADQKAQNQSRRTALHGGVMAKWMPIAACQGRLWLSIEDFKGFCVMAWCWRGAPATEVSHGCDTGVYPSRVITEAQLSHYAVT